jgi:glycosyltransferase involved in cell wall biosynthesis
MRILFVNDGLNDAGGVQSYLTAVTTGLLKRGHELCFLHCQSNKSLTLSSRINSFPYFSVEELGLEGALEKVKAFNPDVSFSHNMNRLDIEQHLIDLMPVVKLMHGYFGTCIGGQKTHLFPSAQPCAEQFGKACLLRYLPQRCGELNAGKMMDHYRWAKDQNRLFKHYAAMIVASRHMKREYAANGMDECKITVNPLFSVPVAEGARPKESATNTARVLFAGRMTKLKGGDVLMRAVREASRELNTPVELVMMGDGPQRSAWEKLAHKLNVAARFTGWISDAEKRLREYEEASLLAVPSLWPEPFGLVGLEAAGVGVPAIAFEVGGIGEWLEHGKNGVLVPLRRPAYKEFGKALARILSDRERLGEMGRAARIRAAEMSLENHLNLLENILAQVLTRQRAPQRATDSVLNDRVLVKAS